LTFCFRRRRRRRQQQKSSFGLWCNFLRWTKSM
jgi:hypothetical protein